MQKRIRGNTGRKYAAWYKAHIQQASLLVGQQYLFEKVNDTSRWYFSTWSVLERAEERVFESYMSFFATSFTGWTQQAWQFGHCGRVQESLFECTTVVCHPDVWAMETHGRHVLSTGAVVRTCASSIQYVFLTVAIRVPSNGHIEIRIRVPTNPLCYCRRQSRLPPKREYQQRWQAAMTIQRGVRFIWDRRATRRRLLLHASARPMQATIRMFVKRQAYKRLLRERKELIAICKVNEKRRGSTTKI